MHRKLQEVSPDAEESFNTIFKPGFIRISLPFHASEEDIDFMIEAVKYVAKKGWKLLPLYKFNIASGTFRFIECEYLVIYNFGVINLRMKLINKIINSLFTIYRMR